MKYIRSIFIVISCVFLVLCHTPIIRAYENYHINQVNVQWEIEDNGFMRVYETYYVEYFSVVNGEVGFQVKLPLEKKTLS